MKPGKFTRLFSDTVERLSDYSFMEQHGMLREFSDSDLIPSAKVLEEVVELCRSIFFPGFYGRSSVNKNIIKYNIGVTVERVYTLLTSQIAAGLYLNGNVAEEADNQNAIYDRAAEIASRVIEKLPCVKEVLATDVEAAYKGDPAATSYSEVVSCYPIIKVLCNYRLAHILFREGVPLIPRMLTEMAHSETGIDIHPGAEIGTHFTVDHGTGVVIGATCIIGNNVKLYQGVTLGAKSFPLAPDGTPIKGIPRHPILKDNVIVYSNATILGRVTVGEGAVIGGNLWVTDDVPANAHLTQYRNNGH